jgi:dTDP-4-dehydrorhamnose reductase
MKVIILGANGMLGSMLEFVGSTLSDNTIFPIKRDTFDVLLQPLSFLMEFIKQEPCCIVNCIGAIPQRSYIEDDMTKLNTTFPLELAELCNKMNIPLIHISTNCVFSGEKSNHIESESPSAIDIYGKSKANGEPKSCVVLRCSIIGPESSGTSFGLMEWFINSNEDITGYTDHYWNGVTTFELAKCIYEIIDKKLFTPRIEHIFSINTLSKYDILLELKQYFNKNINIQPISKGIKYYTLHSIHRPPQKTIQEQIKDLDHIMNEYREYMIKDLFLITSVIQTGSNHWSYTHIRSVYTPEERFEQTLKTIESIRALKDGTRIMLCECSNLDEKMENVLREKTDFYVNCYNDSEIQEACILSNKKGYGEVLLTKYALSYLEINNIKYKRMFKISGRYWLTNAFEKSRFSTKEYTFDKMIPNSTDYPTVLYSVPYCLRYDFKNIISECHKIYIENIIGLELILAAKCFPKQTINGVGVAGYVSVCKSFYSSP